MRIIKESALSQVIIKTWLCPHLSVALSLLPNLTMQRGSSDLTEQNGLYFFKYQIDLRFHPHFSSY